MSYGYSWSVPLPPHGGVGSAVCDCGILGDFDAYVISPLSHVLTS